MKSGEGPLITVGIPTIDRLSYLKEAVDSALAQTYPSFEILISQDPASSKLDRATQDWCELMALRHGRIRYHRGTRSLGLAGNWNALADIGRGEYLTIIGDDDRLLPDFLETLVKALGSDVCLAFSNHYLIDAGGNRLEERTRSLTKRFQRDLLEAGKVRTPERWAWRNSIPIPAALLRRADIQRLRFKEDLNTPEIELFIRLAKEGGSFVFVPEYLMEYRVHAGSETAKGLRGERLIEYLSAMPVSPEIEPDKRQCLSECVVGAVGRYLLQGNTRQARAWLVSELFPARVKYGLTGLVYLLCSLLPGAVGSKLYALIQRIRAATRRGLASVTSYVS